jgi:hypothetical protein
LVADAFRGHGLSLLDSQARLWGLRLVLFPQESPPPSLQSTDLLCDSFKKEHKKIALSSKMKLPHNIPERTIFFEQSNDYY